MGLFEDLRQLSEQVKKRQAHIKGEEATKQALVLPFLQVLGYDIYDPTEIRPEYIADFAKKKSNGQMEKIDYALYCKGAPAILVECKSIEARPEDHDRQLARYFNATPSVKIAVVTNGICYRFYTDLRAPNIMDPTPFFECEVTNITERVADMLRPFTRDGFDAETIQRHAEEVISIEKVMAHVDELLRNPSESFVRYLLEELKLWGGRINAKVIDRFTPIVKKAVQTTLVSMMTKSIRQEIVQPPAAAPPSAPPIAMGQVPVAPTQAVPAPDCPPAAGSAEPTPTTIETTEEELEIFRLVQKICAESSIKVPIKYKDTQSYFGINMGRNRWFLRAYCNGPKKSLICKVPIEQANMLGRGFQVAATPDGSRIYITGAADIEKLRALVMVAYEEEAKRADEPEVTE